MPSTRRGARSLHTRMARRGRLSATKARKERRSEVSTREVPHLQRDLAVAEHEVDLEAALRAPEVDP